MDNSRQHQVNDSAPLTTNNYEAFAQNESSDFAYGLDGSPDATIFDFDNDFLEPNWSLSETNVVNSEPNGNVPTRALGPITIDPSDLDMTNGTHLTAAHHAISPPRNVSQLFSIEQAMPNNSQTRYSPHSYSKRQLSEKTWKNLRPLMKRYYIDENLSLKQALIVLKRDHGIEAAERVVKAKLREWKFCKNLKKKEYDFISRKILQAEKLGKRKYKFRFNGKKVPDEKIERHCKTLSTVEQQKASPPSETSDIHTPSLLSYSTFKSQSLRSQSHANNKGSSEGTNEFESMVNRARVATKEQRYSDAYLLYKEGLDGLEVSMGPTHISTLKAILSFARFCTKQNRVLEAEERIAKFVESHQRILGINHRQTIRLLISFGSCFYKRRLYDSAEKWITQAKRNVEEAHADNVEALFVSIVDITICLVIIYKQQHLYERAEHELLRLCARADALGSGYRVQALEIKHQLAHLYMNMERNLRYTREHEPRLDAASPLVKAETMLREVVETIEREFISHCGLRICCYQNLITIYKTTQEDEKLKFALECCSSFFATLHAEMHLDGHHCFRKAVVLKMHMSRAFARLQNHAQAERWCREAQHDLDMGCWVEGLDAFRNLTRSDLFPFSSRSTAQHGSVASR